MSSLLPSNASALERVAAEIGARATDLPVLLRSLWNPDTCRLDLLPWLAWAWSVDDWSDAWSEQQRRDTVAQALAVQRIKGTIGAVRRALGAVGLRVSVQEWFNQTPAGQPYTFRLLLEVGQVPMTPADLARVFEIVANTKNLRSHLESVLITVVSQVAPQHGTACRMGSEITVSNYQPPTQPREAADV
ncbi:phage tail protein I [Pseudomonas knackmussii]|uniref:phage tail protein I n=1 Tax=Pseudomonas knackmussii TaxID=65741 RepID=UPI003F4A0A7F